MEHICNRNGFLTSGRPCSIVMKEELPNQMGHVIALDIRRRKKGGISLFEA